MKVWGENEIRAAWREAGLKTMDINRLLYQLDKQPSVTEFADTDTITVKELREAYAGVDGGFNDDSLLAYIREHRENCPAGTVWMDRNNVIWQRTRDERWAQFGSSIWANTVPARPLRQMKVQ